MFDGFKEQKTALNAIKGDNVSSKHAQQRPNDALNSKKP
jgi:hypothetical protein